VAGFVDVTGYLTLLHIFTSHLSGNSVAMIADLARHDLSGALRRGFPIPMFVLGVFLCALTGAVLHRHGRRHSLSLALGFEAALLAAFVACHYWLTRDQDLTRLPAPQFCLLTGLLALAMGVQSAALRRVWGKPVHTTFVTGMLTSFAENAALLLLNRRDSPAQPAAAREFRRLLLLDGGIWCAFVFGAACGGFGKLRWDVSALLAPCCVLLLLILSDLLQPLATP
jgi:uncharacterized membrane protein YoaK (UPF0700 family)